MTPQTETLFRALARSLKNLDEAKELLEEAESEVRELELKLHALYTRSSPAIRGGYEHAPDQTRIAYTKDNRPTRDFDDGKGDRSYYRSATYAHLALRLGVGVPATTEDGKKNGVWLTAEERISVREVL